MAKDEIKLIIQGGILCAAFSFVSLFIPIVGIVFNYFSLLPLFYVGLSLGIRGYLAAITIPLIGSICLLGISGFVVFSISIILPSIAILYWHFLKKADTYVYSNIDILHLFTSSFFVVACLCFAYFKFSISADWLANLHQHIEEINKITKVQTSVQSIVESLPGVFSFLWLLMIWVNFQIAYGMALKANISIRKPRTNENRILKPTWDIALVSSLWLMVLNSLFAGPEILKIFARTCACISSFPLLIDGIETIQLIARARKMPRYTVIFSMIVTFMLVWPMIFIVLLGLVEPWYGLKQKYLSKRS